MEIIFLSGYTEGEKIAIARGYLIPRQLRENGLRSNEIAFDDDSLRKLIRSYTREAGVRSLEREIGSVCRKIVTRIAEGKTEAVEIHADTVVELLGRPHFFADEEIQHRTSIPGVATGLAWTSVGGDVLFIEATRMPGSKGFQVTGSVGNVMQESARAALSYVRANAAQLGLDSEFFEKADIHLHIPAGSQPKDGPSAGVTMATALVSLISGRLVKAKVGMTGEITLRGQVLPVGGIKEKALAAHRFGLRTVILPLGNQADLDDLPDEVRQGMEFIFSDTVQDVLDAALEPPAVSNGEQDSAAEQQQPPEVEPIMETEPL
jgi:ATP-dependent Lon protease